MKYAVMLIAVVWTAGLCDYAADSLVVREILAANSLFEIEVKEVSTRSRGEMDILKLSGYNLFTIPNCIGRLKTLVKLDLSKNQLRELPDSIVGMDSLRFLILADNQFEKLPASVGALKSLREIDVSRNNLTRVPDALGRLVWLQRLNLSTNQISDLPKTLADCISLRTLYLDENQFKTLPAVMKKLSALRELKLNYNQFKTVNDVLGGLENLQKLEITSNPLASLPSAIGRLQNLTELNLSQNSLDSLPPAIGGLIGLIRLDLKGNDLVRLPDSLTALRNLKFLNVAGNELTALPEPMGRLKNLTELDLARNTLRDMPKSMTRLGKLRRLNIDENQLCLLDKSMQAWLSRFNRDWEKDQACYSYDSAIVRAILDTNGLTRVRVDQVASTDRTRITGLDLSSQGIGVLPEAVGRFSGIRSIRVSNNQLTRLPDSLERILDLKKLFVDGNLIANLPKNLWHLNRLDSLDLTGNQLCKLNDTLKIWAKMFDPDYEQNQDCREYDTIPPEIKIDEGVPDTLFKDVVQFTGTVSDASPSVRVIASANEKVWVAVVSAQNTWSVTVYLVPGQNKVTFEAIDIRDNKTVRTHSLFYQPDYFPLSAGNFWKFSVLRETFTLRVDSAFQIETADAFRLRVHNGYWSEDTTLFLVRPGGGRALMADTSAGLAFLGKDTLFLQEYLPQTKSFGKAQVAFVGDITLAKKPYRNCVRVTFKDPKNQLTRIQDYIFAAGLGPVALKDRMGGKYFLKSSMVQPSPVQKKEEKPKKPERSKRKTKKRKRTR